MRKSVGVLSIALCVFVSGLAWAGTARYSGKDDKVRIVHPNVAYSMSSLHSLGAFGRAAVYLPYTWEGLLPYLEAGDFSFTFRFADIPHASQYVTMGTCFVQGSSEEAQIVLTSQVAKNGDVNIYIWPCQPQTVDVQPYHLTLSSSQSPRGFRFVRSQVSGKPMLSVEYETHTGGEFVRINDYDLTEQIVDTIYPDQIVLGDASALPQEFFIDFIVADEITLEGPTVPDVNNGEALPKKPDVDGSGDINAVDVQAVVNAVLGVTGNKGQPKP